MKILDWLMIIGYFSVLATVVVVTLRRRRIASGEDLFLGGRSVGWLAVGASLFAANIGSEHLIGLAGSGASVGLSQSHWELNSWIIVMMAWVFLPFYYKSGVTTMPEFLEPIMKLEITTPPESVGEVLGDLNGRRGTVLDMEQRGEMQIVHARVPMAQMFGYATAIRSLTKGRASYSMEPSDFALVPKNVRDYLLSR